MYSTATRAKSRDSCVSMKEAVAAAEADGEADVPALVVEGVAAAGVVVGVVEVRGGAEVSTSMVGLMDVVVSNDVEMNVTALLALTAFAVGVGVVLPLALAGEEAESTGQSMPSKVTRAFSEAQERLAELKRARMTLSKRGMEKLV